LKQNTFTLVPGVVKCRDGGTWVREIDSENRIPYYWAIFEFLPGDDKYTWIENDLSGPELTSAAEVLAHLHDAAAGFQPASDNVANSPLITKFFQKLYDEVHQNTGPFRSRSIQELVNPHKRLFLSALEHILTVEEYLDALPEIAIHSDYHPGNLKFRHERVVGVFDFDWSQMGQRSFDLSLALIYFAGRWGEKDHAGLDPNRVELFLGAYAGTLASTAQLSTLSAIEVELLPSLLAAANLFILKWELAEYAANPLKRQELTNYIDHNVRLMTWINQNTRQMQKWISTACNSYMGYNTRNDTIQ
jgi:homoserine kinase type II